MSPIIGVAVFVLGLAAVNWTVSALFRWIPELARRQRRPDGGAGGGGLRRHRPHPKPHGNPTGDGAPVSEVDDRRPATVS